MTSDKLTSKVGKIIVEKMLNAPSEKLALRIISQFQAYILIVLYSILVEFEYVNHCAEEHVNKVDSSRWTIFLRAIGRGC